MAETTTKTGALETLVQGLLSFTTLEEKGIDAAKSEKFNSLLKSLHENVSSISFNEFQQFLINSLESITVEQLQNEHKYFSKLAADDGTGAYQKFVELFAFALKEKNRREDFQRRRLFGTKLRLVREIKRKTQADVAKSIGVTTPHYTNIENGQREPSLKVLVKLATLLNVSTDWLLDIPIPR